MNTACENCPYCWKDVDDDHACCHWEAACPGDVAPCDEPENDKPEYRYTVVYFGHIFEGDNDDYNAHGYNRWEDAIGVYNAYHDSVSMEIADNEYGVTFVDGEWY